MATITKICVQEKDKNRCNIYLDGEYSFSLSSDYVLINRIKVGDQLTEKQVKELMLDGEKSKALAKGINYVSKTLKTKKQVKTYLYSKGYSDNVVYYVCDKLTDYGYINDYEYAKRYIEGNNRTQGKQLILFKLMQKGVSKDIITTVLDEIDIPSKDNALDLAKKHFKNKEKTIENLSKTYKYLIGRGFSYSEAENAINELKKDD